MALSIVILHTLTNGQYGFHRDELATLDDARHLAWGYVAYPPFTPFIARVELVLFGTSLAGFRFFGAVSQGVVTVLGGLMARELGASRPAQLVAASASAIIPVSLFGGAMFHYVPFDAMWWAIVAYLVVRLLKSADPRWWLGIGAAIGLGMLTKYTMGSLVWGILGGVLFTPVRRHLKSPWLWCGVALSVLILLPNILWQAQHHFVWLDFVKTIHARDIREGHTDGFLLGQLWKCTSPPTLPLWVAGLYYLFFVPAGKRYRLLGWTYVIPLVLFFLAKGRDYYLAAAYPMLFAAGAVWGEQWVATLSARGATVVRRITWRALAVGGLLVAVGVFPVAPVNSAWWRVANTANGNWGDELGWPELVATVAQIRDSLPAEKQKNLGILAGNYGEAGAINLYGPAYGLPNALSGINSYWLRGYGESPPTTLILVGFTRDFAEKNFASCAWAGRNTNPYGVRNEETVYHPDLFVCGPILQPWPEFWRQFQYFG